MSDFQSFQNMQQQMRNYGRLSPNAKRHYDTLVQKSGQDINASPDRVEAEMERRLLVGNKDMRDLNWRGVDTRNVKANTNDIDASGVTMDAKTTVGRAIGIKLDQATVRGRVKGDINGGSARRADIRYWQASHINRNGFDDSGSLQLANDYSFTSSIGTKSINVRAALVSHVGANRDKSTIVGGWHQQCYFDGCSLNEGTVVGTGLDRSSLNDMFGRNVNFQPKLTDANDYSLHGTKFIDSKISQHVAVKAQDDNATLEGCKIVGDIEAPKLQSRHDRFASLTAQHAQVTAENDNAPLAQQPQLYRPQQAMRLAAAVFGIAA